MAKTRLQALQDRLTTYGEKIGATLIICKNERGYFISINDNEIALTSGRSIKELAAYIDGFRDMLIITMTK